jgi:glycerophosphoryl diester phosphodiesterase
MRQCMLAATLALMLAGCAAPRATPERSARLPLWFDCLRERGEAVVGAHRAGPAPGLPENALTTMAATLARNPDAVLEIDVRVSADDVLILLHDDRLDRTTSGTGLVRDRSWAELAELVLRDNEGARTAARIPKLADALALAKARGAVVQLDVKRGVDFAAVVAAVREGLAADHVIIITYNDADALAVAGLAPELMQSVDIDTAADAARLIAGGVRRDRMLAWTGTSAPRPDLFTALRAMGIEPLFGTLGRRGERLDDRWLADGDAQEFAELERSGAVIVATDRGREVEQALGAPSCRR